MKTKTLFSLLFIALILIAGCTEESSTEVEEKDGLLEFKTLNPMASMQKSTPFIKSTTSNPPLTGPITKTITTSFNLAIGDVWVSQEEVIAGTTDDLEWIRLTSSTNTELKLFEDYSFLAVEIPAGTYRSIKITFRNIFYRYCYLVSDPSIKYNLLESMRGWTDACDANDTTWAKTNYFSQDGNHSLNDNNVFELVSEGEKLGGFSIEAGKTAVVSWRLGADYTGTCYTYLIDENSNLKWDCGVDRMDFECVPDEEDIYMWDFVVKYININN